MKKNLFLFVFLVWCARIATAQSAQQPMNIIFILADDHRYDAMGFMKNIPGL